VRGASGSCGGKGGMGMGRWAEKSKKAKMECLDSTFCIYLGDMVISTAETSRRKNVRQLNDAENES
jgi:hypothetical protein